MLTRMKAESVAKFPPIPLIPIAPASALRTLITHRLLTQRPDSSVFVLLELRLDRASQKPIVLGKLRYIKKDVEWDLRKVFGARVDARFSVIVGHRKG